MERSTEEELEGQGHCKKRVDCLRLLGHLVLPRYGPRTTRMPAVNLSSSFVSEICS